MKKICTIILIFLYLLIFLVNAQGKERLVPAVQHKYTNQLIHESSPYLLQHAHNPVNWYPWGEEVLRLAREKNKPIFLSIGYAACHWCHVMEHESFENEQIAEILNEHFLSIKVDREERPDLDDIYMNATDTIRSKFLGSVPSELELDFPGVIDGARGMAFIEAVVESNKSDKKWYPMKPY